MQSPSGTLGVVLLSGGMDSCVTLAQAIADGITPAALHVNYGQRTQQRELQAFTDICNHYSIERRLVVDISHLAQIGGSALTDQTIAVPQASAQHDAAQTSSDTHAAASVQASTPAASLPITYVPFRNANILAIATSWAEVLAAKSIYIGAVEEDSSGYPDCREVFFTAFETVIATGTGPDTHIKICTPLIHRSKQQIVELGMHLKAPLHLSWSCYANQDAACGICDSCQLRLKGFTLAGIADPIRYMK